MSTVSSAAKGGHSLAGILAILLGSGALFIVLKYPAVAAGWSDPARYGAMIGSLLCLLWGIDRLLPDVRGTFSGRRHRRARHTVMLPRQGVMCLVIMSVLFIGSMIGRSNMLMLVFAMMVGPFVVNGWIIFSMLKRLGVERRVPKRTMAGEPAVIELELSNGKRWISNWLMSVEDNVENTREKLTTGVVFTRIPPRARRSGHYQVRLMQRGKYRVGPLHVTTRFPLGLVERGLLFDLRDEILVYPRMGRLATTWKREHLLAADLVQQRQPRRGAFDDEFHRIREYRWGDNPRAIHWRTSARHNELMVRQYRQSRDRDLMLILDLWVPRRPTDADYERSELAVSLAATICIEHMRESRDSKLQVITAGRELGKWNGETAATFRDSLLDTFALVEAGPEPPIDRALDHAAAGRAPGTAVILISSRPPGESGAALQRSIDERRAGEALGDIRVISSDADELASFFEIA